MSPRRHRRREAGAEPPRPVGGLVTTEDFHGTPYAVRAVSGERAVKVYRCPGCDQEIRVGQPHLLTWPAEGDPAVDRRHWHRPCWAARERRGAPRGH